MSALRTILVAAVVVGLIVPAGAVTLSPPAAGTPAAASDAAAADTPAAVAQSANDSASNDSTNDSSVSVGAGQQLSTVIAASEDEVGTEVEDTAFELSYEGGDETEQAEAVADRAAELRERALEIRADYREATREYENGEISRSEYAQRLAVLNARARNVIESRNRLQRRAANVSGFELTAAGYNRTALRAAVADLDAVTGAGATALMRRFTGRTDGSVELERADGLSIEVESEDGERSREFERPRDDDDATTVNQSAALATARDALSTTEGTWTLSSASVDADDGSYEFAFVLRANASTGEAEVGVDGSTGEVFALEEEIEPAGDDADERDEEDEDREDDGDEDDPEEDDGDDEADDADEDGEDEGEIEELALVVADGTPAPNATVTVLATSEGGPVANATVLLDGEAVGETGPNGTLAVTLPDGSATLVARAGGEDAELEFEFEGADDERDSEELFGAIETSASLDDGTVALSVTYDGSGVANVTVYANDERVGTTGADGSLTFETSATEELELELVKGELEAELEYRVEDGSLVLESGAREGDGDKAEDGDDEREEEDGDDEDDGEDEDDADGEDGDESDDGNDADDEDADESDDEDDTDDDEDDDDGEEDDDDDDGDDDD